MTIIGCAECGTVQTLARRPWPWIVVCRRCRTVLERQGGRSLSGALAASLSAFLLLIPANFLPFLTTSIVGVSRHSRLISSAAAMWADGWALLAVYIGLFVVVFPLLRFGLLCLALGALRLGRGGGWTGPVFRWACALEQWAMLDVFLLGLWVAYARLTATIDVSLGPGAVCFAGAALMGLFTRAALDRREIWSLVPVKGPILRPTGDAPLFCPSCDLAVSSALKNRPCPRCGARLRRRSPFGVSAAAALTLAGLLFYIPANLYPIATLPIGLTPTRYTVLQGVIDLLQAHLLGLAVLVFSASFLIPLLKLAGLGYCLASVIRRSSRRLVLKTRIYRVVEEVGRWSMVDPFVIACFVPVTQYNALIYGRAEAAAPAFATVVVTTMIAAQAFDPRLIWDAAADGRRTGPRAS